MIQRSLLEQCVSDQRDQLLKTNSGIERVIKSNITLRKEYVTIVTGIRRCGKSTLMHQLIHDLNGEFAYFHFEDPRIFGFSVEDFQKLEAILGMVTYYFFDEIQNISGWELFIRKLHDQGKFICITGSNASLLSRELGTRLTGRNISKELFPFDFEEYCSYFNVDLTNDQLENYLSDGGFPIYLATKDIAVLHQLLRDLLYRDIIARHAIRNGKTVEELALYLISNVAKPYSLNGLKKIFELGSANSVADYLAWLEDSYLFFSLPRFSWSLKSIAVNQKKIYTIDTGFALANSLSFSTDKGRLFENMIYLALRRKHEQLYYFREKGECDFVIREKDKIVQTIQACYDLNSDNLKRELNGLKEAMAYFNLKEGMIVTLSQEDKFIDGNMIIHVLPAAKWLRIQN
jgi:predicted AAA+ superfamily ATPase